MTDAQVAQVAVEVVRTNLAVDAQVAQVAVEVLRPNVGKGVVGSAGSYTLTGKAAVLRRAYTLAAAKGTFTFTGVAATKIQNRNVATAKGTFTLTGKDANLKRPGKIFAEPDVLTLTGRSAILVRKFTKSSAAGSFALTGKSAGLRCNRRVVGAVRAFTLTGIAINISRATNVVDPVTGITIFHRLRTTIPAYANADAAYIAWAANLGVSATGTDYTVTPDPTGVDFVTLDQPVLDGSIYSGINLPHSGAVGLYMFPPGSTAASSVAYTWGLYSLGYLMLPTQRPVFMMRAFNNNAMTSQFQNTNLKLRKAYNPTTGVYEVIVIMTSASTASPQQPIRCAYRLANGYIEGVFTVEPADMPSPGYFYINYIVASELSDIAADGDNMLISTTSGTFGIVSDDYSLLRPFMTDTLVTAETANAAQISHPILTDALLISREQLIVDHGLTIVQAFAVSGESVAAIKPAAIIEELFDIAETCAPSWKFSKLLADRVSLRDALLTAFPVAITDTATLTDLIDVFVGVVIAEQLRLVDTPAGAATYAMSLVDVLKLSDDLRRFLGGSLTDGVIAGETWGYDPILGKVIAETFNIADSAAGILLLRVTVNESVVVEDTDILSMIFAPVLTENIDITIGYIAPNGDFTTWAVNTRTGAVTEYQNFEFNSFAQLGHKYLGTSSSGLYELDGDTDDGTAVIADIKSGYAQFGGSRYTSFKAAYLGMRGDGEVILRLDTGDGNSYTYQTMIQDMQSTKVRLGKGLRARYFSFELISTGPDFDLDTVEFLPLVAQRRV